jgi:hypothetical protein
VGNEHHGKPFLLPRPGRRPRHVQTDVVAAGEPVITIFFPQDTANEYPGSTLVHELTHRDLVDGSLTGALQVLLSSTRKMENCPAPHRQAFQAVLEKSVSRSRLTHEAVATYVGLIHQATTDPSVVERIYKRLPPYYRTALSTLEAALPKCLDLAAGSPHLYRNVALALGKHALNTPALDKLLNIADPSLEKLAAVVQEDAPDVVFQDLLRQVAQRPATLHSLLDIVRQAPAEAGFASFDAFLEGAGDMPREELARLIFTIDQRLMAHLDETFGPTTRSIAIDSKSRIDLVNALLQKWNAAFHDRYGHAFAGFNRVEMRMDAQPRIRITPSSPEVSSGKRTFSEIPSPMMSQADVLTGVSMAKSLGLWIHARMFINPGDRVLSLGPTAPPLNARHTALMFAPCLSDATRTDEARQRLLERMQQSPLFCQMSTSLYIENRDLPGLITRLADLTVLWHVDWIMYNYARAAGIAAPSCAWGCRAIDLPTTSSRCPARNQRPWSILTFRISMPRGVRPRTVTFMLFALSTLARLMTVIISSEAIGSPAQFVAIPGLKSKSR